jgi:acyl-CoA thioesterase FadM
MKNMHLLLRTIWHFFVSSRQAATSLWAHTSVRMRAWPTDIDIAGHINNGMYFSLMDLGRFDLMMRSGMWKAIRARKWTPVMSAETISFRKSIELWQKYTMETRVIGFDERAMYFEQCMVVDGDVYVRAFMAMRLVHKGKPVSNAELFALVGEPPADLVLPDWIHTWRADVALPGARKPAPFSWSR